MSKNKILMIPSWYPTKENPIHGSFFKEQAMALSEYCDFCILHLNYFSLKKTLFTRILKKTNVSLSFTNEEDDGFLHVYATEYVSPILNILYRLLRYIEVDTEVFIKKEKEYKYREIYEYIKKIKFFPDVIYAMTAQSNGIDSYNFGKTNNLPVILAEHSPFPVVGTTVNDELREAMSKSNRILVVSRDKARQILMQNIQCNPIVVGNMIDENKFNLSNSKPKIFTILIVGAYNFYKDYETFFKAVSYLKQITNLPFKVKIVGYMPVTQISIWSLGEDAFLKHLSRYNLVDICELLPMIPRDEMPNIYKGSSVFVMTSIQEGLSVAALEASCCGLPVFSTRCGGVEDYVTDDYGRLFDLQDWKSIAISLKEMMEGGLHFNRDAIRKNVVSHYGVSAFTKRLNDIFTQVIKEYNNTGGV